METDILAVTARLRSALRAAGGNRRVAVISGVPLGTIDNMVGGTSVRFAAVAAVARACNVSLDWIAIGRNDPRSSAIDLDTLTDDVIDAWTKQQEGPLTHWEQVFDVLKVALEQPSALPPMLRPVVADQHAVANTGDRAVVQPQAATARTNPSIRSWVDMIPPGKREEMLDAVIGMAFDPQSRTDMAAWVLGYYAAIRAAE